MWFGVDIMLPGVLDLKLVFLLLVLFKSSHLVASDSLVKWLVLYHRTTQTHGTAAKWHFCSEKSNLAWKRTAADKGTRNEFDFFRQFMWPYNIPDTVRLKTNADSTFLGTAVAQWLRCCATNRKVAGSIPPSVGGFFIDIKSFRSHYGPGVDSASSRNEYQEYFLGVRAAGA